MYYSSEHCHSDSSISNDDNDDNNEQESENAVRPPLYYDPRYSSEVLLPSQTIHSGRGRIEEAYYDEGLVVQQSNSHFEDIAEKHRSE